MSKRSIISKNRVYMKIWLAQLISLFGDVFYDVAVVWYLVERTGSALLAGGIAIFSVLGKLIGSALVSKFIDMYKSRSIVLITDFIRGVILLLLIILINSYEISIYIFYIMSFVISFLTACFTPARNKSVIEIVDKESIANANAFDNISTSIVQISSWGLGGFVVANFGVNITLIIDCISFFLSFLLVFLSSWEYVVTKDVKSKNRNILIVSKIIFSNNILKRVVLFEFIYFIMLGFYWSSLPLKIEQIGNAFYYGLQGMAFGIGSLLTSVYLTKININKIGIMYLSGIIVHLLGNSLGGFTGYINIFIFGVFIAGLGNSFWQVAKTSIYQTNINKEDYGKTLSTIEVFTSIGLIISWTLGGYLADRYSPSNVMVIVCLIQLLVFIILMLRSEVKGIKMGN